MFASHWLKRLREILMPITKLSNGNLLKARQKSRVLGWKFGGRFLSQSPIVAVAIASLRSTVIEKLLYGIVYRIVELKSLLRRSCLRGWRHCKAHWRRRCPAGPTRTVWWNECLFWNFAVSFVLVSCSGFLDFAYTTNERQATLKIHWLPCRSAGTPNNHLFTQPLHSRITLGYNARFISRN